MKKVIRLTESDLIRIVKRIINEEKYSESDLIFTHPETNKRYSINVAEFKPAFEMGEKKYHAVAVDIENDSIGFILPVVKNTYEEVNDFICKNIDRTFEILTDRLKPFDIDLMESIETERYKVIDKPINCNVSWD